MSTTEDSLAVGAGADEQQVQTVHGQTSRATNTAEGATSEAAELSIVVLTVEGPTGKSVKVETTPADCILDVRQFLLECPETCDVTCYHLEFEGNALNDYAEIANYPELLDPSTPKILKIVPDFYDERLARGHVRRVRELLVKPPMNVSHTYVLPSEEQASSKNLNSSQRKKLRKEKERKAAGISGASRSGLQDPLNLTVPIDGSLDEKDDGIVAESEFAKFSVTSFQEQTDRKHVVECVRNVTFSAWNPPPGNRRLRGDLFYLEISTLEGNTLYITSSVDGFFVNSSTVNKFDPKPNESPYKCHSLLDLLKKASLQFAQRFSSMVNRKANQHPFESIEVSRPVKHWLAPVTDHTYDWNRAEDALLNTHGMDNTSMTRDWNEEYQSVKELPRSNLQERLVRDRTHYRIFSDFVDAATKGAVAIAHGNILSINPMDPKRSHVFIYNNIFFSFAIDGRDQYKDVGGDKIAYQLANHDLRGVAAYAGLDIPEIHTLATTIIDYRGHRLIAQSIIPGIFHGDKASTHVYGSMDQGEKIVAKPEFHEVMKEAGRKLHIGEHKVRDQAGETFTLSCSVESKGIIGSDARSYVLDMIRTTPRDANFPDPQTHPAALLRPELITLFCRQQAVQSVLQLRQDLAKRKSEAKDKEGEEPSVDKNEADDKYLEALTKIQFNPDIFTSVALADDADKIAADTALIKSASEFLVKNAIPKLVDNFKALEQTPVDGSSLTRVMHDHGVNMRYLAAVAKLAAETKLPHIEDVCVQEMITRAAKHILNAALTQIKPDRSKDIDNWFFAPSIAHFLSSFLGPYAGGNRLSEDQIKAAKLVMKTEESKSDKKTGNKKGKKKAEPVRLQDGSRAHTNPFSPANLWQSIRDLVQSKFNYELPAYLPLSARQKLCMLRSICQKCGIQVQSRDYDLEPVSNLKEPFTIDDILDLHPVVKAHFPVSKDATDALEAGKAFLNQGRLEIAYQYLNEAVALHNQVYGPMHRDSAQCYSGLALVCYHAGDVEQAVEHQQRAVIISERVLGLDHPETAHAHSNLALYLHSVGNFQLSIKHIQRALFLFELMCGPNHPDTAATHINLAMIYQDTSRVPLGLKHLQEALRRHKTIFGNDHSQVALSHHTLAIAYSLMGYFRNAIMHEKKSKAIFTALLGPKHPRTQQSLAWLNRFTSGAVKAAQGTMTAADQMLFSPLTWVSLRSSTPFKGQLTMNDMLQLFEVAAARQASEKAAATSPSSSSESASEQPESAASSQKKKGKKETPVLTTDKAAAMKNI